MAVPTAGEHISAIGRVRAGKNLALVSLIIGIRGEQTQRDHGDPLARANVKGRLPGIAGPEPAPEVSLANIAFVLRRGRKQRQEREGRWNRRPRRRIPQDPPAESRLDSKLRFDY